MKGSVGDKKEDGTPSENIRSDVMKVQMALSTLIEHHRLMVFPPLKLNAVVTRSTYDPTILAIRGYQRHVLGLEGGAETGVIDKGWEALRALNDAATRVTSTSPAAPTRIQIENKLKALLHCDEFGYFKAIHDPNGTISCILSKLVNQSNVDDSFYQARSVDAYLNFSGAGTPPPLKPVSIINALSVNGLPATDAQTFKCLKEVVLDLLNGIIKARQVDVYQRSAKNGVGAAVAKLEAWMVKQSNDPNSVYSCCKPQLTSPDGFWGRYLDN